MADITMPQLGETVTEGTITAWLKAPGDHVAVDESLLEISTDKVDSEIPSPVAGVLAEIVHHVTDVMQRANRAMTFRRRVFSGRGQFVAAHLRRLRLLLRSQPADVHRRPKPGCAMLLVFWPIHTIPAKVGV